MSDAGAGAHSSGISGRLRRAGGGEVPSMAACSGGGQPCSGGLPATVQGGGATACIWQPAMPLRTGSHPSAAGLRRAAGGHTAAPGRRHVHVGASWAAAGGWGHQLHLNPLPRYCCGARRQRYKVDSCGWGAALAVLQRQTARGFDLIHDRPALTGAAASPWSKRQRVARLQSMVAWRLVAGAGPVAHGSKRAPHGMPGTPGMKCLHTSLRHLLLDHQKTSHLNRIKRCLPPACVGR